MLLAAKKLTNLTIEYGKHNPLTIFVRAVALFSLISYMTVFYDMSSDQTLYTKKYLISQFIRYFAYGFICNFGLYFITTQMAKKHCILSTLFYLPTVFSTPFFSGHILGRILGRGDLFVTTFFIFSLFIYYYFNPWRNRGTF